LETDHDPEFENENEPIFYNESSEQVEISRVIVREGVSSKMKEISNQYGANPRLLSFSEIENKSKFIQNI
jgi:hypothetical protein